MPKTLAVNHLKCINCGGETVTVKVTKTHFRHGQKFKMRGVEAEECVECRTRYFSAKTLKKLDREIDAKVAAA
jgi:YgiT-type zinc finger domain-containing protein